VAHNFDCCVAVRDCPGNADDGADRDGAVRAKRADAKRPARNDVLTLREPPPKDMPMPMVTRVTARRPS
jgi:hypothetical protein